MPPAVTRLFAMADNQQDLSIVIVNFHSGGQLLKCLRSLRRMPADVQPEIIVIDNSPSEAKQVLRDAGQDWGVIRVIESPSNSGYAAACNMGLAIAQGRCLLFLNPDTHYVDGSLRQLLHWFDENPSVALVGPRINNQDGTRQFSCRSFPSLRTAVSHSQAFLTRHFPANALSTGYLLPNLDGQPTNVDWASGCCLFARRDAILREGGFDDGYFLFFEDVDLAFRLKQKGWQTFYYPHLSFVHQVGASRAALQDEGFQAKHSSAARYFSKNVIRNRALAFVFAWAAAARARLARAGR